MKTIRLLTIGNSFANNALTYLQDLAASTGEVRFEIGRANLGGCSLQKHWNLAQYTRRNPDYGTYRLGASEDGTRQEVSLQKALAAAPWDCVTLQQVSWDSWRRDTFQPFLRHLHELIRERAPQATVFLHQTWAYRSDSPFFPQNGLTQEITFERIREAYAHYAGELRCPVLPSGQAVQEFRQAPGHGFSWPDPEFEYRDAQAPALPRQENSLAVGWRWAINSSRNGIPELRLDANHLNATGCYLVGCVWYECLTGLDARSVTFRPEEADEEDASFLRATAHKVCASRTRRPLQGQ